MSTAGPNDRMLTREEFEACRAFVLTVLDRLHLDFSTMGLLGDAGPYLHQLMSLAYHAEAGRAPGNSSPSETDTQRQTLRIGR